MVHLGNVDQSRLHGALERIRDLGVDIIDVVAVPDSEHDPASTTDDINER